jgi:gas vesicle protein
MNKIVIIVGAMAGLLIASCSGNSEVATLERKIESLELEMEELKEAIAPGLAELMNQNNDYMNKVEVAVEEGNWEYAGFCLHEMEEVFEKIEEVHENHDELVQPASVQLKAFVYPVFEELESAVEAKDAEAANAKYVQLKNNCSSCHQANNHGFIVL